MTDHLSGETRHPRGKVLHVSIIEPVTRQPPVLRDHMLMANGVVSPDKFYHIHDIDGNSR